MKQNKKDFSRIKLEKKTQNKQCPPLLHKEINVIDVLQHLAKFY